MSAEKPRTIAIREIEIDKLGVDECNIRKGLWDGDEEFVNNIKMYGVLQNLIVRPADPSTGKEYAIVSGSRRYYAALEAELDRLLCRIMILTDPEAMALSMAENRNRSNTPTWMDIEYTGKIYHCEEYRGYKHKKRIDKLGLTRSTVEKYLRVYGLRDEVKGLLRKPEERSGGQTEYLKRPEFQRYQTNIHKMLPIEHADLVTKLKHLPVEKQVEVSLFIMNFSKDVAKDIIDLMKLKSNSDRQVEDVYNENVKQIYETHNRNFNFNNIIYNALEKACTGKHIELMELCLNYIKKGLKEDGYLGDEIEESTKQRGLKEYISDAEPNCESVAGGSHA